MRCNRRTAYGWEQKQVVYPQNPTQKNQQISVGAPSNLRSGKITAVLGSECADQA
jgi:hypothetical protein